MKTELPEDKVIEIVKTSLQMTNKKAWAFFMATLPRASGHEAWRLRYQMKRQAENGRNRATCPEKGAGR